MCLIVQTQRKDKTVPDTFLHSPYSKTIDYLLSDGDQIGEILGATGQVTNRFMYGPGVDMVLSEQQFAGGVAQSPQYQLTDHLGTVRGVAQRVGGASSATLVNAVQYDSFGKVTSQSNATNQPHHGFAGRDIEPVGGLTYNRNRYYSTSSGRFISQDPISFAAGDTNLYRYTGNSPTNRTDPTGLDWEWSWEWHHLLPKDVFEKLSISGVDINSKDYGFMLRAIDHRGEGVSIHSQGWNRQWQEWVDKQIGKNLEITKESIDKQLKKMMKEFDLPNKGFPAKYGYDMAEKAYKAADEMRRAGRPVASRAVSKATKEAIESASTKAPKVKLPVKAGGIIGFFVGIFAGSALGSEDSVGDAIDGLVLTSPMGDSEWRPDPYGWWNDYQRELDEMQADRDAYEEYLDNCPRPPDDFYGPWGPHERF